MPFLGSGVWAAAGRLAGARRSGLFLGSGIFLAGAAGGRAAGGGADGGAAAGGIWSRSTTRVPPPFTTPSASSDGSNTNCTSPSRTSAPGARGASPFTRSPVDECPVGRVEVDEDPDPLSPLQLGVRRRNGGIGDQKVVVVRPPDVHDRRANRQPLALEIALLDEQGGQGSAARRTGRPAAGAASDWQRPARRGSYPAARAAAPTGGGNGWRRRRFLGDRLVGNPNGAWIGVKAKLLVPDTEDVGAGRARAGLQCAARSRTCRWCSCRPARSSWGSAGFRNGVATRPFRAPRRHTWRHVRTRAWSRSPDTRGRP